MSIQVSEFRHILGKNDAEYIKLLKEALERQKQITSKAIAKIKELSNYSESPNNWIPCTPETMPEPRIDVWCNSDLGQTVGYYDETCDMWLKNDYTELIVTAWMPLPKPYEEKE